MKKTMLMMASILMLLSISACTNEKKDNQTAMNTNVEVTSNAVENTNTEASTNEKVSIQYENELVLASAQMAEFEYIEIVMKKGTYSYDQFLQKATYTGEFYMQHYKENELVNELKIEDFANSDTYFNGAFQLYLNDYNNDGNKEFLVGQGMSERGTYYRMYTLSDKNEFKQIDVGNEDNCLYIYCDSASCDLENVDADNWKYKQYDQEKGTLEIQNK